MALASQIMYHLRALFGYVDDGPGGTFDVADEINRAFQGFITLPLSDAGATNNITKTHIFDAYKNITVQAVSFVPDAAAIVNATNYAFISVYAGTGSAAAATSIATGNTATGSNMAAGTPYDLTLTSTTANLQVDAGETLAMEVIKYGAGGLDLPAGNLVIHYIYR